MAWKTAIREAIQTWAEVADINVGFVEDDGSAAGALGPWRGDPRFGDIRVFGVALSGDTWAEAIDQGARTAGTWAGDIIFNTAANWTDVGELKTAAIHELGHILGLGHSEDPASPMHQHGPSGAAALTTADIDNVQALQGMRRVDANEVEGANDALKDATEIKGSEQDSQNSEGFDGSQVWIQFGSIDAASDVDYFQIELAEGYRGPVAVEIRTAGYSLAEIHGELVGKDGQVLASGDASQASDDRLLLELENAPQSGKLYIRLESLPGTAWGVGDYSVTVAEPQKLVQDQVAIASWAQDAHRWFFDSEGAENGFSYQLLGSPGDGLHADDEHGDDDRLSARDLPLTLQTSQRTVYVGVGTVSDLADIDYYRVQTPPQLAANSRMLIDLQSLTVQGLVPNVVVTDHSGVPVPSEFLARGYGSVQLVIDAVEPDTEYFVRLDAANAQAAYRVGNFSLTVDINTKIAANDVFLEDDVTAQQPSATRTMYVARTQLVTFGVEAQPQVADGEYPTDLHAVFRLYDQGGQVVTSFITPLGELRSLPGLLLEPGEYYPQVTVVSAADDFLPVRLRVVGSRPSLPIGPLVASIDNEPLYSCQTTPDFCYPDGTQSGESVWVTLPPADPPPPANDPPVLQPPDGWFWRNLLVPTNAFNSLDVNGDFQATPIDALIVINYINRHGSGAYPQDFVGYLDVNGDGSITPIDALRVINRINRGG